MKQFSIKEAISFGWDTFKKYPLLLIGVTLTVYILPTAIQWALEMPFGRMGSEEFSPASLIGIIISVFLSIYLSIGLIIFYLKLVDGKKAVFKDIFTVKAETFIMYFLASLVLTVVAVIALMLPLGIAISFMFANSNAKPDAGTMTAIFGLILILGILFTYLGIRFQYYTYLIIDKQASIMDSFTLSLRLTKNKFWHLFLLNLASGGVVLVGFLAIGIGALVAYPVVGLAQAMVYRKLEAATKKD